jgi:hydroxylamine reductase (hybrid-cluster protein)
MTTLQIKDKKICDLHTKCHNFESKYRNDIEMWMEETANMSREIERLNTLCSMLQRCIVKVDQERESFLNEKSELLKIIKEHEETIARQNDLISVVVKEHRFYD